MSFHDYFKQETHSLWVLSCCLQSCPWDLCDFSLCEEEPLPFWCGTVLLSRYLTPLAFPPLLHRLPRCYTHETAARLITSQMLSQGSQM